MTFIPAAASCGVLRLKINPSWMMGLDQASESARSISDVLGKIQAFESTQRMSEIWAKQIGTIDLQLATNPQMTTYVASL